MSGSYGLSMTGDGGMMADSAAYHGIQQQSHTQYQQPPLSQQTGSYDSSQPMGHYSGSERSMQVYPDEDMKTIGLNPAKPGKHSKPMKVSDSKSAPMQKKPASASKTDAGGKTKAKLQKQDSGSDLGQLPHLQQMQQGHLQPHQYPSTYRPPMSQGSMQYQHTSSHIPQQAQHGYPAAYSGGQYYAGQMTSQGQMMVQPQSGMDSHMQAHRMSRAQANGTYMPQPYFQQVPPVPGQSQSYSQSVPPAMSSQPPPSQVPQHQYGSQHMSRTGAPAGQYYQAPVAHTASQAMQQQPSHQSQAALSTHQRYPSYDQHQQYGMDQTSMSMPSTMSQQYQHQHAGYQSHQQRSQGTSHGYASLPHSASLEWPQQPPALTHSGSYPADSPDYGQSEQVSATPQSGSAMTMALGPGVHGNPSTSRPPPGETYWGQGHGRQPAETLPSGASSQGMSMQNHPSSSQMHYSAQSQVPTMAGHYGNPSSQSYASHYQSNSMHEAQHSDAPINSQSDADPGYNTASSFPVTSSGLGMGIDPVMGSIPMVPLSPGLSFDLAGSRRSQGASDSVPGDISLPPGQAPVNRSLPLHMSTAPSSTISDMPYMTQIDGPGSSTVGMGDSGSGYFPSSDSNYNFQSKSDAGSGWNEPRQEYNAYSAGSNFGLSSSFGNTDNAPAMSGFAASAFSNSDNTDPSAPVNDKQSKKETKVKKPKKTSMSSNGNGVSNHSQIPTPSSMGLVPASQEPGYLDRIPLPSGEEGLRPATMPGSSNWSAAPVGNVPPSDVNSQTAGDLTGKPGHKRQKTKKSATSAVETVDTTLEKAAHGKKKLHGNKKDKAKKSKDASPPILAVTDPLPLPMEDLQPSSPTTSKSKKKKQKIEPPGQLTSIRDFSQDLLDKFDSKLKTKAMEPASADNAPAESQAVSDPPSSSGNKRPSRTNKGNQDFAVLLGAKRRAGEFEVSSKVAGPGQKGELFRKSVLPFDGEKGIATSRVVISASESASKQRSAWEHLATDPASLPWKLTSSGRKPVTLSQFFACVQLHDPQRKISIRLDDTGTYYILGTPTLGKNATKWILLQQGRWTSQASWSSFDGLMGVSQGTGRNPVTWNEHTGQEIATSFSEVKREVFVMDSSDNTIYRVDESSASKASIPSKIFPQNFSFQDLDAIKWTFMESGSWKEKTTDLIWRASTPHGFTFSLLRGSKQSPIEHSKKRSHSQSSNVPPTQEGEMVEVDHEAVAKANGSRARGTLAKKPKQEPGQSPPNVKDSIKEQPAKTEVPKETFAEAKTVCKGCKTAVDKSQIVRKDSSPEMIGLCKKCHEVRKQKKKAVEPEEEGTRESRKKAKMNKELESRVLSQKLADLGLCLVEIAADDHCLFSALCDQLRRSGTAQERKYTFKTLRRMAADYMLHHKEHFKEFLSLGNESFEEYCRRIANSASWGGQHELLALSHCLQRNIEVFRHDITKQEFPDPSTHERYDGTPLRLSYHMHEYSGGEHYNSVVTIEEKQGRRRTRTLRGDDDIIEEIEGTRVTETGERVLEIRDATLAERTCAWEMLTKYQEKPDAPDARVPMYDTRTKRILLGNCSPMAKNLDEYLKQRPHMKVWDADCEVECAREALGDGTGDDSMASKTTIEPGTFAAGRSDGKPSSGDGTERTGTASSQQDKHAHHDQPRKTGRTDRPDKPDKPDRSDKCKVTEGEMAKAWEWVTKYNENPEDPDIRVPMYDTRVKRILLGNCSPMSKNVEEYLKQRPFMKIWDADCEADVKGEAELAPVTKRLKQDQPPVVTEESASTDIKTVAEPDCSRETAAQLGDKEAVPKVKVVGDTAPASDTVSEQITAASTSSSAAAAIKEEEHEIEGSAEPRKATVDSQGSLSSERQKQSHRRLHSNGTDGPIQAEADSTARARAGPAASVVEATTGDESAVVSKPGPKQDIATGSSVEQRIKGSTPGLKSALFDTGSGTAECLEHVATTAQNSKPSDNAQVTQPNCPATHVTMTSVERSVEPSMDTASTSESKSEWKGIGWAEGRPQERRDESATSSDAPEASGTTESSSSDASTNVEAKVLDHARQDVERNDGAQSTVGTNEDSNGNEESRLPLGQESADEALETSGKVSVRKRSEIEVQQTMHLNCDIASGQEELQEANASALNSNVSAAARQGAIPSDIEPTPAADAADGTSHQEDGIDDEAAVP